MSDPDRPIGRRALLGWSGAAGVTGLALGGLGVTLITDGAPKPVSAGEARLGPADAVVADRGLPMGLADRVPAFGTVLAFDLAGSATSSPAQAREVARTFLRYLAKVADGEFDASVALDLRAANLQVTPGLGASLLIRCALDTKRPEALVDLPAFAGDELDPGLCGGDLMVQIASEDPMKTNGVVAAVLAFVRASMGAALALRWSRSGFQSTAATAKDPATTRRNLMGHRDGTANLPVGSPLWKASVLAKAPDWMAGGSYLVARQIFIDLDAWFSHGVVERDRVIGRRTDNGAALGEASESQTVDLTARTPAGEVVIPADAHIRLANPQNTGGARIYRRGWNFDDGHVQGVRRAGLMFLAWQADPRLGFIPIQQTLTERGDALSQFVTHRGSAVFAAPARGGDDYVGQRLLEGS